MANSENLYVHRTSGSFDAATSPDDLQRSVDQFGGKLRQLKEQESYAPSREWLEDAERWHRRLKMSLEDYRRERAALQYRMARAQQLANESAARRNVQPTSLHEYAKTAGQTFAEGFRKSRDGLTRAFNRALGRDQESERGPRVTKPPEAAIQEDRHRASGPPSRKWKVENRFGVLGRQNRG
jgi:hypothetical protein